LERREVDNKAAASLFNKHQELRPHIEKSQYPFKYPIFAMDAQPTQNFMNYMAAQFDTLVGFIVVEPLQVDLNAAAPDDQRAVVLRFHLERKYIDGRDVEHASDRDMYMKMFKVFLRRVLEVLRDNLPELRTATVCTVKEDDQLIKALKFFGFKRVVERPEAVRCRDNSGRESWMTYQEYDYTFGSRPSGGAEDEEEGSTDEDEGDEDEEDEDDEEEEEEDEEDKSGHIQ